MEGTFTMKVEITLMDSNNEVRSHTVQEYFLLQDDNVRELESALLGAMKGMVDAKTEAKGK